MTPEDDKSTVESAWEKNMGQFLHQLDPEIWKKHILRNYNPKLQIKGFL